MIKKLLGIVVLGLLWCNVSFSENFKCEIHPNLTYIIKADNLKDQYLATVDMETGKFDENSVLYNPHVFNGELIEFRGDNSKVFKLAVLSNSKKGDASSFRGIYFEESYVHSLRIDTWKDDLPIFIYNDWTQKEIKGSCK